MRTSGAGRHPVEGAVLALAKPVDVVALRALGLGDFLTGLPALRALRDSYPGARLTLVTHPGLVDFAGYAGVADRVVPLASLAPLPDVVHGAALMVNLHGRGPESHQALLAAGPERLIAFADAVTGTAGPAWRPGEHEVHRWCRLLDESGIPADPGRLDLAPPPPPHPKLAPLGATVIHSSAAFGARRWPPERWAAVARAETEAGHPVALTGSEADLRRVQSIARRAGLDSSACLAGATDLVGLAGVVASAGLVLSGDTGVAHLATALGRPSVVLFGPVPPAEWGPPPDRRQHIALWAGRRGDPHGRRVDPGLLEITVADVLAAIARLRAGSAVSGAAV
ncbi:MAG: glycosyltransferase family 9 protein [Acidimicrobiales bacterium]